MNEVTVRRLTPPLLLILATLAAPAAASAALPAPWRVLPWGDGPGDPGLRMGGDERPTVGPVALAASHGRVVISDPVHRQLLVLDAAGLLAEVVPTPFVAVDLALLPDGAILALDALGDRVHLLDAAGAWRTFDLGPRARLAGVAVGPDGAPWVVDSLGRARPLLPETPVPTGERATPLGLDAAHHAAGRRADAHTGEVLVWRWAQPAEVKPPGPALTLPIATAPHLLGAVRPQRVDAHGTLHVLVERLADTDRVEVHAEVRRYDLTAGGAELDRVAWPLASVAPVNRYAAVADDGALLVMAALPEGLALWRLPAPARAAGGAR